MHILQTVGQALHLRPVLLAVHNVPKTTRTKFPSDDAEVLLCALPVKSKSLPQWLRLGDFQKPWIAGKKIHHINSEDVFKRSKESTLSRTQDILEDNEAILFEKVLGCCQICNFETFHLMASSSYIIDWSP